LLDLNVLGTPEHVTASPAADLPPTPEPVAAAGENVAPETRASVADDAPKPTPSTDLPFVDLGEATEPEPAIPAANTGPFVTETMAELYLRQGHRDEALRVYRALLTQRPGDAGLQARIAELEPKPVPPPAPAGTRSGPSMRDLLAAIARRRPGSAAPVSSPNGAPGGQSSQAAPSPAALTSETRPPEPAPSAPTPSGPETPPPAEARPNVRADGLSALFGSAAPSQADESAARSLALAFAGANGAGPDGVGGAPARRASDELSLDSVFGGDTTVAPEPASFSFDQFFSRRAATEEMPTPATAAGDTKAASPDEIAHFTKWLEGLKQK